MLSNIRDDAALETIGEVIISTKSDTEKMSRLRDIFNVINSKRFDSDTRETNLERIVSKLSEEHIDSEKIVSLCKEVIGYQNGTSDGFDFKIGIQLDLGSENSYRDLNLAVTREYSNRALRLIKLLSTRGLNNLEVDAVHEILYLLSYNIDSSTELISVIRENVPSRKTQYMLARVAGPLYKESGYNSVKEYLRDNVVKGLAESSTELSLSPHADNINSIFESVLRTESGSNYAVVDIGIQLYDNCILDYAYQLAKSK